MGINPAGSAARSAPPSAYIHTLVLGGMAGRTGWGGGRGRSEGAYCHRSPSALKHSAVPQAGTEGHSGTTQAKGTVLFIESIGERQENCPTETGKGDPKILL